MTTSTVNRRDVIAGAGAFVMGFYVPLRSAQAQTAAVHGAAWYSEPAVPEINAWIVVERLPRASVPHHYRARAVLTLGDLTLEAPVLNGVRLYFHG